MAEGPGTLITSEIAYPGWEATVDGIDAELTTHAGLLRAIELGPGSHDIEFVFRPTTFRAGLLISLLALIVLVSLWVRR